MATQATEAPRGEAPAEPTYTNDADMETRLSEMLEGSREEAPKAKKKAEPREEQIDDSDDDTVDSAELDEVESDDSDDDSDAGDDAADDDTELDDDSDDEGPDALGVEEETEFEYQGKRYKVPKPLVEGAMRADRYREVMAETGEHRAYIAEQAQSLRVDMEFSKQVAPIELQAQNIASYIEQLESQLPRFQQAGDVAGENETARLIRGLQAEHRQLVTNAANKKAELISNKQAATQRLIEAGNRILARAIPNWGADAYQRITQHAASLGYTAEELRNALDPRFIKMAHDSMELQRLKGQTPKTKTTVKRIAKAAPVVRPGAQQPAAKQRASQTERVVKQARKTGNPADAEAAIVALMRRGR